MSVDLASKPGPHFSAKSSVLKEIDTVVSRQKGTRRFRSKMRSGDPGKPSHSSKQETAVSVSMVEESFQSRPGGAAGGGPRSRGMAVPWRRVRRRLPATARRNDSLRRPPPRSGHEGEGGVAARPKVAVVLGRGRPGLQPYRSVQGTGRKRHSHRHASGHQHGQHRGGPVRVGPVHRQFGVPGHTS